MKPFLKWPGGKYRLVKAIQAVLPKGKRLIEPFVGSGALFLNSQYDAYLLADTNEDLINLFKTLQTLGEDFIQAIKKYFVPQNNSKETFIELRALFNTTKDITLKSALFIYLNRHCFNGICRVNSRGEFNVPFGRYDKPYFPEEELRYFYLKSQRAIFLCQDFVTTMQSAESGDVLYCDPPYVPLSVTSNFTSYSKEGFGEREQYELAKQAEKLSAKNIPVVISNHATKFTKMLYQKARIEIFNVRRMISCKSEKRNKVSELLAVYT